MPQELPGFYYDAEKRRYFRIPPGGAPPRVAVNIEAAREGGASTSGKDEGIACRATKQRVCRGGGAVIGPAGADVWNVCSVVRAREVFGPSGAGQGARSRQSLDTRVLEIDAQRPQVWRYDVDHQFCPDSVLAHVGARVQTAKGLEEMPMVVAGSRVGLVSSAYLRSSGSTAASPTSLLLARPHGDSVGAIRSYPPPSLEWSKLVFSGGDCVCAILPLDIKAENFSARILVASIGGQVMVVDPSSRTTARRVISPFDSIHTAKKVPGTSNIIVGSLGKVFLFNYQQQSDSSPPPLPLVSSSSSVLSLECESKGGCAIFCGFRNGAISTIDPRSNTFTRAPSVPPPCFEQLKGLGKLPQAKYMTFRHPRKRHGPPTASSNPLPLDPHYCSHSPIMRAPSAVVSLKLIRNDVYILSSSMDGSLLEWDRRFSARPVRAYEGHYNTHSHLPLAVDPSESLLMSGGEDCRLRIWSLASGRLLYASDVLPGRVNALCEAFSPGSLSSSPVYKQGEEDRRGDVTLWRRPCLLTPQPWAVWMGIAGDLWYMSGSGLCV